MSVQPVTPEILATFSEGFECYNRHDFDAMEAMYAPHAVVDLSRVFLDERPRQGRSERHALWEEMWDIYDGLRMDPVEVLNAGGDRYVVVVKIGQRGKRSGADVAQGVAFVYTLDEGLVSRMDMFPDRNAALAAAKGSPE